MPINIAGAYNQRPSQQADFPKIELEEGPYQASFIGLSEPYMTFDRFKGCLTCGPVVESNPKGPRTKGPGVTSEGACVACEGTGMLKVKEVALKYVLDHTDELVQESATYKLSPPASLQGGRVLSASKLYTRFRTFSGLSEPGEIIAWANDLPEDINVPVTLIIKGEKYRKISDVLKRFEPQNGKKPEPRKNREIAAELAESLRKADDEIPF